MTEYSKFTEKDLIEAHEASDVSAINGIVSLVNILRKRGLLTDAETSAMYESMSLPLGLPKYAENPAVQELQLNLDRLFAMVVAPNYLGPVRVRYSTNSRFRRNRTSQTQCLNDGFVPKPVAHAHRAA